MVFGNKYMFDLFEELKDCSEVKINKVALVIDIRERDFLYDFLNIL